MALLARTAGVVWNTQVGLLEQLLEQQTSIPEQRLAQTQLDSFQIAHPLPGKILANQLQEGFGFLESFGLDFRALKFFLRPGSASASWVI